MFIAKLLAIAALAASPTILFNQSDVSGSTLFCNVDSLSYDTSGTVLVQASSCIPDRIFTSDFENPTPHQFIDRGN